MTKSTITRSPAGWSRDGNFEIEVVSQTVRGKMREHREAVVMTVGEKPVRVVAISGSQLRVSQRDLMQYVDREPALTGRSVIGELPDGSELYVSGPDKHVRVKSAANGSSFGFQTARQAMSQAVGPQPRLPVR